MDDFSALATCWHHQYAVSNGVRLHYVEAGSGPVVVLLHGFPEFWYSWRHQIPTLAAAGFHVIAPDMRGYNESDKPGGVESYRLERLTADVARLLAHAGAGRAAVVGHDWGGVVAWSLAMRQPQVVEKLVILNAPHPAVFLRQLWQLAQLLKSWYIFFFQFPWLPERFFRAGNFALLEKTLRHEPVNPGAFTEEDIRQYKQALAQPGALTAAINYYRSAFRHLGEASRRIVPIAAPTLLIWGERDRYLGKKLTEGLDQWVPNLRVEHLPEASHWVQNDVPDRVNRLLMEFLQSGGSVT